MKEIYIHTHSFQDVKHIEEMLTKRPMEGTCIHIHNLKVISSVCISQCS